MIGCTKVVSVSTSCSRCYNLTWSSFSPYHILMYYTSWMLYGSCDQQYIQHRYTPVSLCFTIYTIPLLLLKTLPQLQSELQLKVVTFGKASTSSPCKRGAIRQTKQDSVTCWEMKHMQCKLREAKTSSRRTNEIEALLEQLGSLQINKEVSTDKYEPMDTEMSVAPAPVAVAVSENVQAGLPKNMVLDPGWFDGD